MQRCKARSKRSGKQCKNYAIKNCGGVCRMHGARGGPKTKEGLQICKRASLKHGLFSQEEKNELRQIRNLTKMRNNVDSQQTIHKC